MSRFKDWVIEMQEDAENMDYVMFLETFGFLSQIFHMVYAQVMFYVDFCDRGLCLALLMRAALPLNFLQIYGFVVFFVKGEKKSG